MEPKLFRWTVAIIGFLFAFTLGPDTSNHYPWYQFPYQLHHYGKVTDTFKICCIYKVHRSNFVCKVKTLMHAITLNH